MHPLTNLRRIVQYALLLAMLIHTGVALALDDCTLKEALSIFVPDLDRGCPKEEGEKEKPAACILLDKPKNSAQSKFDIEKPGHYCLTEDLHARLDFADHPAESAMIIIWTSDVVLDLQGHTLGRGMLFKNPGGVGISINDAKNIHIKNGVLQDFRVAVLRGPKFASSLNVVEPPVYDAKTNTYRFPATNIVIENVTFRSNKKDILVLDK